MASAQVVETPVTNNSPSQDSNHPGALLNTGTEWNGTEYTGTRQNDAGMKRNAQEWCRNVPERAGMTAEWNGMDKNGTGIYRNKLEWHCNEEKDTSVTPE